MICFRASRCCYGNMLVDVSDSESHVYVSMSTSSRSKLAHYSKVKTLVLLRYFRTRISIQVGHGSSLVLWDVCLLVGSTPIARVGLDFCAGISLKSSAGWSLRIAERVLKTWRFSIQSNQSRQVETRWEASRPSISLKAAIFARTLVEHRDVMDG